MRLSRKAADTADLLVAGLAIEVRALAAKEAEDAGREFATEEDVRRVFVRLAPVYASEPRTPVPSMTYLAPPLTEGGPTG